MATDVTVRASGDGAAGAAEEALAVFAAVEKQCTRFDPSSDLMRANGRPGGWTAVGQLCLAALREAQRAYEMTGGRFDPRVLSDLVALGYDRSLPFGSGDVAVVARPGPGRTTTPPWRPVFREASGEVLLGNMAVDLGGIGKGLAVRWAADTLRAVTVDHLVEAGGDCWCSGRSPDGGPWLVGVEHPLGGESPLAVLALSGLACATSSLRVRHWRTLDGPAHHIIDPRTGRPGGGGLSAVTVVGDDPAEAEVWAKVLFLEGRHGVGACAAARGLAALWVDGDGEASWTPQMDRHVVWSAP